MIQNTLKYSVILLLASERPLLLRIPSNKGQGTTNNHYISGSSFDVFGSNSIYHVTILS